MIVLLGLYGWTLAASAALSPTLALLGSHLATRDRALQTLCMAQGSTVGVLLAIGLYGDEAVLPPFIGAAAVAFAMYLVTEALAASRPAAKNTLFALVFASLVATGHLIAAVFPSLESHLAQRFFGDLATLTVSESKWALALASVLLLILFRYRHTLAEQSFDVEVFGEGYAMQRFPWRLHGFRALALVTVALSVQFVGFLFTASLLFVPTGLLVLRQRAGLSAHQSVAMIASMVCTVAGFLISLKFTRLPTVPTVVLLLVATTSVGVVLEKVWAWLIARKPSVFQPALGGAS